MKRILGLLFLLTLIPAWASAATLDVVTTTTDLASITEIIGGEVVRVTSLARGNQDHHYVEPRPSMVVTVRDADLLIMIGMDHDIWVQALINSARNRNIRFGQSGYLDVSQNIRKLEVPSGQIDGSMGHLHVYGNPHYWLDPLNGKIIASDIASRLSQLRPDKSQYFQSNLDNFKQEIDQKIGEWQEKLKPFKNEKIAVHHGSWPYFAQRFNLEVAVELEPKPGLAPTPSHLRQVVDTVKQKEIKVIISEVFHDRRPANFVADETGARAVVVPSSVGGVEGADDYFKLFDLLIDKLVVALKK